MKNKIILKIVNTIDQVPREPWDAMIDDNPYISWGWLKTVEETSVNKPDAYYILALFQDQLVGGSVCSVIKQSLGRMNIDDVIFGRLKKLFNFFNISMTPLLNCAPIRGRGTQILVKTDLNKEEKYQIIEELLDQIEKLAKSKKLALAFTGINENQIDLRNTLTSRGYYCTEGYPINLLVIRWPDFEDYRHDKTIFSKNMRGSVSRQINRNRDAGVVIRETKAPEEFGTRLHELATINYEKYNKMPFIFNESFFAAVKNNLGDDSVILIAVKNEQVIGVKLLLKKNEYGNSCYVGIDHETAGNDFTYFNLTYYATIRHAIQAKMKRIDYGNAMYYVKIRRGCTIQHTYIFFRPSHFIQNIFFPLWFRFHRYRMNRKLSDQMRRI